MTTYLEWNSNGNAENKSWHRMWKSKFYWELRIDSFMNIQWVSSTSKFFSSSFDTLVCRLLYHFTPLMYIEMSQYDTDVSIPFEYESYNRNA